jgi:hypothetical protein
MPRRSSPCRSESSISIGPTSPVAEGVAAEHTTRERCHHDLDDEPVVRTASVLGPAEEVGHGASEFGRVGEQAEVAVIVDQ